MLSFIEYECKSSYVYLKQMALVTSPVTPDTLKITLPIKITQGGRTHVLWNIYGVEQQAQAEDWYTSKSSPIDYTEVNNKKMD